MGDTHADYALTAAAAALLEVRGQPVTYCAGALRIPTTAVQSLQTLDLSQGNGATIEAQRVDWLIPAADLAAAGVREPEEGHAIETTEGQATNRYELRPIGADSHYRPRADGLLRLHTRQVK
jgi:hypothetical protein